MGEVPSFLLEALQFQDARRDALRKVTDAEWNHVLSDWHVVRLTLPLRQVCGNELPGWVRERIDGFLAGTALRFERIKDAYSRAAKALDEVGTDHVVIKGFSLWPGYTDHPKYRPQSDIDLYCPPETILRARDAILSLGYTTSLLSRRAPSDHLASLIPPNSWVWRGNHFDPRIPISFELHFCWWNHPIYRIRPRGLEEFWPRRVTRAFDDLTFRALEPVDSLGYVSINLLQDLLKHFPAAEQVYGLARFLHTYVNDRPFWQRWRELHDDSLRRLEVISFRLASEWFACRLPEEVQREVRCLPPAIQDWFKHFSKSTFSTRFNTRKDGVWLHLDLLDSQNDKLAVLLERIVPVPFLMRMNQSIVGDEGASPIPARKKLLFRLAYFARRAIQSAVWVMSRSYRHSALLPLTLWRGLVYRLARKNLGTQFWMFFAKPFCSWFGSSQSSENCPARPRNEVPSRD